MTGRHRRLDAASEPTPRGLSAAVTAAVATAHAVVDERAGFEESVLTVFADVVWRLHNDRRMVGWRAEPEVSLPAVVAAATTALPVVVDDVAKRLDALATASDVELDDSQSLAELLVRMAHALLLVHHGRSGGRAELDSYVQRHVSPLVRSAVAVDVIESRGPGEPPTTRRRRRVRADLVAATLIAVLVGSAGWITAVSRSTPPSVTPSNLTETIRTPPQRGPEAPPAQPSPSLSATPSPSAPDVPVRVTEDPSGWNPVPAAPPPFRAPVTAAPDNSPGSDGRNGTDGPDGPPSMAGPHVGFSPQGGPQSRATTVTVNSPGGGFGTPPKGPSMPASGGGASKPDFHSDGGHPDGPRS